MPKRCGLYIPGHEVHAIQARLAGRDLPNALPAKFLGATADGDLSIEVNGELLRLWSHDPDRLQQLAFGSEGPITYQRRWGLLRVVNEMSSSLFCVAGEGNEVQACPSTPPGGTPEELLRTAGGFLIQVDDFGESDLDHEPDEKN